MAGGAGSEACVGIFVGTSPLARSPPGCRADSPRLSWPPAQETEQVISHVHNLRDSSVRRGVFKLIFKHRTFACLSVWNPTDHRLDIKIERHETFPKVKPKRLNHPLVADCSICISSKMVSDVVGSSYPTLHVQVFLISCKFGFN